MRSEPSFPAGGTSAGEPIRSGAGLARRIGTRLLHEVREAVPPTIFFFVGFNFILLTSNLLVADMW